MAEGEIKPGSWLGDSIEEFKRLPTWGKVGVGAVVVGVAGLAYWQLRQSQSQASTTSGAAGTGMGIPAGATDTSTAGLSSGSGDITPTPTGTAPAGSGTTSGGGSGSGLLPVRPVLNPTPVRTTAPTSAPKLQTYTVQRGDTLSGIAAKLHLAGGWQSLYNANKTAIGSNPNLIFAGTKLNIPS